MILTLVPCSLSQRERGEKPTPESSRGGYGRGRKELCMPNQMGKRYMCGKCGVEVIITKAGGGTVVCCGQDMVMKK
jgi:desulfoferrodoxin-like iron-binding protein